MFLKCWEILRNNYKSEQICFKMLVKERTVGKVTGLQPTTLPKNEIHHRQFLINRSTLKVGSHLEIRRDKERWWEIRDKRSAIRKGWGLTPSVNWNICQSLCSYLFLSLLISPQKYQNFLIFISRRWAHIL